MTKKITIELTPDQLAAVAALVDAGDRKEGDPLYDAERELDGALLAHEQWRQERQVWGYEVMLQMVGPSAEVAFQRLEEVLSDGPCTITQDGRSVEVFYLNIDGSDQKGPLYEALDENNGGDYATDVPYGVGPAHCLYVNHEAYDFFAQAIKHLFNGEYVTPPLVNPHLTARVVSKQFTGLCSVTEVNVDLSENDHILVVELDEDGDPFGDEVKVPVADIHSIRLT